MKSVTTTQAIIVCAACSLPITAMLVRTIGGGGVLLAFATAIVIVGIAFST